MAITVEPGVAMLCVCQSYLFSLASGMSSQATFVASHLQGQDRRFGEGLRMYRLAGGPEDSQAALSSSQVWPTPLVLTKTLKGIPTLSPF